jgi:transcriptional regulator with XRE-family HTH domain
LRQIRLRSGISQEKFAEMAELHRNYVGLLERGLQSPSLNTMCRLAHALKVKPYELLKSIP